MENTVDRPQPEKNMNLSENVESKSNYFQFLLVDRSYIPQNLFKDSVQTNEDSIDWDDFHKRFDALRELPDTNIPPCVEQVKILPNDCLAEALAALVFFFLW